MDSLQMTQRQPATAGHEAENAPKSGGFGGMRGGIAVVSADTFAGLGLAGFIEGLMPQAEVCTFPSVDALRKQDNGASFFHYFVASDCFLQAVDFFADKLHKTILLVHGNAQNHLPGGFHTLDVCLPEHELTRAFLQLAGSAHGHGSKRPNLPDAPSHGHATPAERLTPRETEVLRLIVSGLINKEIADRLNVSLPTVISHRKNLTEKLGTRSVSALTIYAVAHGLVRIEEI